MIKSFTPRPYDGDKHLPSYATNVQRYELLGCVEFEGKAPYIITLAKLAIGESISAGKPLAHAVFESFDDHGKRAAATRSRMSGYERQISAVKNAMADAGVEFDGVTFSEPENFLGALGAWFLTHNPDLKKYCVLSQTRH